MDVRPPQPPFVSCSGFLLKLLNIFSRGGPECSRGPGPTMRQLALGAGPTRKLGDPFWTLCHPIAAQPAALLSCPESRQPCQNPQSGKRAREKFVMRTVLLTPSASFSLSLKEKNKKQKTQNNKKHLVVILRLECGVGHLAAWRRSWLAGRLAGGK